MVGGDCWRLRVVVDSHRWPANCPKSRPVARNKVRLLFWAFVGALVGVLVAAHVGGGVGGC